MITHTNSNEDRARSIATLAHARFLEARGISAPGTEAVDFNGWWSELLVLGVRDTSAEHDAARAIYSRCEVEHDPNFMMRASEFFGALRDLAACAEVCAALALDVTRPEVQAAIGARTWGDLGTYRPAGVTGKAFRAAVEPIRERVEQTRRGEAAAELYLGRARAALGLPALYGRTGYGRTAEGLAALRAERRAAPIADHRDRRRVRTT